MKIEANPRIYGYNVYCDTDSEYYAIQSLSGSDINPKSLMKCYLNSMYGKAVTVMNRNYISIMVSGTPVIVFKQHIVAIEKRGDKASIYCSNGESYDPSNKYIDIVKQILD